MTFGNYARTVLVITAITQAVLVPLLPPSLRSAVVLGAALATANVLAAFALAAWGLKHSPKAFVAAVVGGMAARMGVVLLAVALALGVFDLPRLPLALSLLGYFMPFLALEIAALHKSIPAPVGVR